ncbi:MAG: hypothetical protein Q9161_003310 [Pseudevernia consocians]
MNRRAEWSIIGLSTINPTSRQVILRDSGNSSIGRLKVFKFGVSMSLSNRVKGNFMNFGEGDGSGTRFATRILVNQEGFAGSARLTGNSSQSRSPSVAEGAAASVSVELEEAVWEAEAAAEAVEAGEVEEADVEDVAVVRKDG